MGKTQKMFFKIKYNTFYLLLELVLEKNVSGHSYLPSFIVPSDFRKGESTEQTFVSDENI